jgi:hypothetical protein
MTPRCLLGQTRGRFASSDGHSLRHLALPPCVLVAWREDWSVECEIGAQLVGDVRAALERMMEGRAGSLDAAGLAAEETLLAHIDVLDPPGGLRY